MLLESPLQFEEKNERVFRDHVPTQAHVLPLRLECMDPLAAQHTIQSSPQSLQFVSQNILPLEVVDGLPAFGQVSSVKCLRLLEVKPGSRVLMQLLEKSAEVLQQS